MSLLKELLTENKRDINRSMKELAVTISRDFVKNEMSVYKNMKRDDPDFIQDYPTFQKYILDFIQSEGLEDIVESYSEDLHKMVQLTIKQVVKTIK